MTESTESDPGAGHRRVLLTLVGMSVLSHSALVGCRIAVTLGGIELGASAFTIGLLMAFFGLLPMILSVPAGRLIDRIGTRKPMFWGLAALTVAILAPALSWEVGALFLASTATGLGFMGVNVAIQKLGGELGGPAARSTNFGMLAIGFSVSSFIGPLLVGPIIDYAGFRAAFVALLALPLATAFWLSRVRFNEQPRLAHQSRESTNDQSVFDLLRDPSLRRVYLSVGVVSAAWDVHQFVVPIYGSSIGMSASAIGILLASYSAATFVIRVAIPWLARRVTEWPMILASHVVGCVIYFLYPFTESLPLMMLLSFVLGMGLGISQPLVLALLHRLAPPDRTGEAVGLRMVLVNGTQTLLPGAFGAIGGVFGVATLFWGMALMLGGSLFYIARGADMREPK
ncbi:MAG: MFS transporter [Betaproteobacteria bacterium]|nr:MFS transporter [Betaproteobacteria bacterium]